MNADDKAEVDETFDDVVREFNENQEPTPLEISEHLGASLLNLLQRCEALPGNADDILAHMVNTVPDDGYDMAVGFLRSEAKYLYENARHVTQLMRKIEELANEV